MTKENLLELTQNDKGSWIQKGNECIIYRLVQKMIPNMLIISLIIFSIYSQPETSEYNIIPLFLTSYIARCLKYDFSTSLQILTDAFTTGQPGIRAYFTDSPFSIMYILFFSQLLYVFFLRL
jgi:hypothetical protein